MVTYGHTVSAEWFLTKSFEKIRKLILSSNKVPEGTVKMISLCRQLQKCTALMLCDDQVFQLLTFIICIFRSKPNIITDPDLNKWPPCGKNDQVYTEFDQDMSWTYPTCDHINLVIILSPRADYFSCKPCSLTEPNIRYYIQARPGQYHPEHAITHWGTGCTQQVG